MLRVAGQLQAGEVLARITPNGGQKTKFCEAADYRPAQRVLRNCARSGVWMMEMAVVGTRILCGSVVTPMPAGSLHQSSTGRSTAAPTKMKSAMSSRAVRFNLFKGDCRRTSGSGTSYMQHYGVPTRLLDWTENPLIAIYFAVEDHKADRDGLRVGMITIPKAAIPSLQEDLVHYGITPATVFPDLTGLCQEICNKWKKG